MIEFDALEQAFTLALALIPVALYFGVACAVAMEVDSILEWFRCFIPDGLETVGDALLWLLLMVLHLVFTPAALVFYFFRGILRINISHIRKDNEE